MKLRNHIINLQFIAQATFTFLGVRIESCFKTFVLFPVKQIKVILLKCCKVFGASKQHAARNFGFCKVSIIMIEGMNKFCPGIFVKLNLYSSIFAHPSLRSGVSYFLPAEYTPPTRPVVPAKTKKGNSQPFLLSKSYCKSTLFAIMTWTLRA